MVEIKDGAFYKDGKPFVFVSADYPYYRDSESNWKDRLIKIKESGTDIVTFYVPWRHHHIRRNGKDILDFDGTTQGNRDVTAFIRMINELGMYAVVKPGPFIHAETDFGGLPDFVAGGELGEAMLDNEGNSRKWLKFPEDLPAPMDKKFDSYVKKWFKEVKEKVVDNNIYPAGPIIALQILNEGMYSDGQRSPLLYDYSESGLKYHAERLRKKYKSIEKFNKAAGKNYREFEEIEVPRAFDLETKTDIKETIIYMEWAETQNEYLGELYSKWGDVYKETKLPIMNNINPPQLDMKGLDYWLTRVIPEKFNLSYGFTNWVGVVSHNESAFMSYLLMVKRARGINMEENWGFSKLYDWRYKYHFTPFYQTLLAMGLGAAGFNVYTGVSTDCWTDELDTKMEKPYPDCSPISEKGETGEKHELLKILNKYLKLNADILLEGKRPNDAVWGLYPYYSYTASFGAEDKDFEKMNVKAPKSGHQGIESFMLTMLGNNREFGILNIEAASDEKMAEEKVIVINGGFFMHEEIQKKLLRYAENGGTLMYFGEIAGYDERMEECQIIAGALGRPDRYKSIKTGKGKIVYHPENPFISCGISKTFENLLSGESCDSYINSANAHIFCYEKDNKKAVFVLSTSQFKEQHKVKIGSSELVVSLPAKGCGIFSIEGDRITSCIVKGVNDYDNSSSAHMIKYGVSEIRYGTESDILYIEGEGITAVNAVAGMN